MKTDLSHVGSLDLDPRTIATVLDEGYRVADSALGAGVCFPRQSDRPGRSLPTMVGQVSADDTIPGQAEALASVLRLDEGKELDIPLLRQRLAVLSETQWYRSIWLRPHGGPDTVSFALQARPAPSWVAGLAVAYNNDLGGRIWLGTVDRRLFRPGLEGSAFLFLGRFRQELFLGVRNTKRLGSYAVSPALSATGAFEDVRQFDADGNEIPSIPVREAVGYLGLERRFLGRWSVGLEIEGRAWREDNVSQQALGGHFRLLRTARNAEARFMADIRVTGLYDRAEVLAAPVLDGGRWSLRPYARVGWGKALPAQLQFPLGGLAGFPGLHIGERLGDREVNVGGVVRYAILDPLFVSGELAVGRTAFGGSLFGSDQWLVGGRVGVGAETPFGPVAIDYGVTDGGRNILLFRFGRWF